MLYYTGDVNAVVSVQRFKLKYLVNLALIALVFFVLFGGHFASKEEATRETIFVQEDSPYRKEKASERAILKEEELRPARALLAIGLDLASRIRSLGLDPYAYL